MVRRTQQSVCSLYYYTNAEDRGRRRAGPAQAITRQEALRLLTMNPAYVTFDETLKGSIEAASWPLRDPVPRRADGGRRSDPRDAGARNLRRRPPSVLEMKASPPRSVRRMLSYGPLVCLQLCLGWAPRPYRRRTRPRRRTWPSPTSASSSAAARSSPRARSSYAAGRSRRSRRPRERPGLRVIDAKA